MGGGRIREADVGGKNEGKEGEAGDTEDREVPATRYQHIDCKMCQCLVIIHQGV